MPLGWGIRYLATYTDGARGWYSLACMIGSAATLALRRTPHVAGPSGADGGWRVPRMEMPGPCDESRRSRFMRLENIEN